MATWRGGHDEEMQREKAREQKRSRTGRTERSIWDDNCLFAHSCLLTPPPVLSLPHTEQTLRQLGRHSGAESCEGWIKGFPRERHESTRKEEGEIEEDTTREEEEEREREREKEVSWRGKGDKRGADGLCTEEGERCEAHWAAVTERWEFKKKKSKHECQRDGRMGGSDVKE